LEYLSFCCLCLAPLVSVGASVDFGRFRLEIKIDLMMKTVRIIRSLIGFRQAWFDGISEPAAGLAEIGQIAGSRH
jgi:hypothetical protein